MPIGSSSSNRKTGHGSAKSSFLGNKPQMSQAQLAMLAKAAKNKEIKRAQVNQPDQSFNSGLEGFSTNGHAGPSVDTTVSGHLSTTVADPETDTEDENNAPYTSSKGKGKEVYHETIAPGTSTAPASPNMSDVSGAQATEPVRRIGVPLTRRKEHLIISDDLLQAFEANTKKHDHFASSVSPQSYAHDSIFGSPGDGISTAPTSPELPNASLPVDPNQTYGAGCGTLTAPASPECSSEALPIESNPSRRIGVPLTRTKANVEISEDLLRTFEANTRDNTPIESASNIYSSGAGGSHFPGAMDQNTTNSLDADMGATFPLIAQPVSGFASPSIPNNNMSFSGNTSNEVTRFPVSGGMDHSGDMDMDEGDSFSQQNSVPSLLSRMGPPVPDVAPPMTFINPFSNPFESSTATPSGFSSFQPDNASSIPSLLSRMGPPAPQAEPPATFVNPFSNPFQSSHPVSNAFSSYQPNAAAPMASSAPSAFSFAQPPSVPSDSASFAWAGENTKRDNGYSPFTRFDQYQSPFSSGNAAASAYGGGMPAPSNFFSTPDTSTSFASSAFSFDHPPTAPSNPVSFAWTGDNNKQDNGYSPFSRFDRYQSPFSSASAQGGHSNWISSSFPHTNSTSDSWFGLNSNAPEAFSFSSNPNASYDWTNSNSQPAYPSHDFGFLIGSNDTEMDMEIYDPPGGCHGVPGIQIPLSTLTYSQDETDPWQNMVIPSFSFEQPQTPTFPAPPEHYMPPGYDETPFVQEEPPVLFRPRSDPPIVETSSLQLGSQSEWMKEIEALKNPENHTGAAALLYDGIKSFTPSRSRVIHVQDTASLRSTKSKRSRGEDGKGDSSDTIKRKRKASTGRPNPVARPRAPKRGSEAARPSKVPASTAASPSKVPSAAHHQPSDERHAHSVGMLASVVSHAVNLIIGYHHSWT